jgi:hypothetical protein
MNSLISPESGFYEDRVVYRGDILGGVYQPKLIVAAENEQYRYL